MLMSSRETLSYRIKSKIVLRLTKWISMKRFFAMFLIVFWGLTPKSQTVGVIDYTEPIDSGYILFAPTANRHVYLVDPCGNKVNEWTMPSVPGMIAKLNTKGDLIYAQRQSSPVFNGGGIGGRIISSTWNGDQLWNLALNTPNFHQHHDVEVLENDNILVLGWEYHEVAEATAAGRESVPQSGLWSETIREYEVDEFGEAEVVWEWRSWDHLVQDLQPDKPNYGIVKESPGKININYTPTGSNVADWLHANSLDYNPELDQIIINLRNLGEFWIIDHSTTTEEAKSDQGGNAGKGGQILYRWGNPESYKMGNTQDRKFFGQHDAHWIDAGLEDEGKIMIFNNGINRPDGNYSTIELVDPPLVGFQYALNETSYEPTNSVNIYGNLDDELFFSSRISGSQRLKNGNTLICSGVKGRFFEITPDKDIVWEYINPSGSTILEQGDIPGNSIQVFQAIKYSPDFEGFIDKSLTPSEKIELNPIDNCESIVSKNQDLSQESNLSFNNWVEGTLFIEQDQAKEIQVLVYNTSGMLVYSTTILGRNISLDLGLSSGIYFLGLTPKGEPSKTHKIFIAHE